GTVAVLVLVGRADAVLPGFLAGAGVERENEFLAPALDQRKTLAAADRDRRIAFTPVGLPEDLRSLAGPAGEQPRFGRRAVAVRPQILRPIGSGSEGSRAENGDESERTGQRSHDTCLLASDSSPQRQQKAGLAGAAGSEGRAIGAAVSYFFPMQYRFVL